AQRLGLVPAGQLGFILPDGTRVGVPQPASSTAGITYQGPSSAPSGGTTTLPAGTPTPAARPAGPPAQARPPGRAGGARPAAGGRVFRRSGRSARGGRAPGAPAAAASPRPAPIPHAVAPSGRPVATGRRIRAGPPFDSSRAAGPRTPRSVRHVPVRRSVPTG